MRIVLIVPKLNVRGGAQRQALELARELSRRGQDVTLYTFALDTDKCFTSLLEGSRVVALPPNAVKPSPLDRFFGEYRAARALADLIDPATEFLHPHAQQGYRVAYYYKKRHKNIPSVWMMNDMLSRRWADWKEREICPETKLGFLKRVAHTLADWYDAPFVRVQDRIVVLDEQNKRWVRDYYGKDAIVIRSGLDLSQFAYIEREPPRGRAVRLLTGGVLFYYRRIEDSIRALRQLVSAGVDATLDIVGSYGAYGGAYYRELVALAEREGVKDRVSFLGEVSDDELVRAYRAHDVFIFANHVQTWGLAVFEAMASGVPVVVSRGSGAHEVLSDGENALLVNPKSPEEIAEKISFLVKNPDTYSRIARAGREFVERRISWKRYADDMMRVFREVV